MLKSTYFTSPRLVSILSRTMLVAMLAVQASAVQAAIVWEQTTIERNARLEQEAVEFAFSFVNSGTETVSVAHVQASCGCVVPELEKKSFAPREKGQLKARMDLRGLTGTQEKSIAVAFAGSAEPVTLTMRVTIPAPVVASARLVAWSVGDEPSPKEIVLTLQPGVKLRPDIAVDNDRIAARLSSDSDALRQRLTLTPRDTTTAGQTAFTLTAELPDSTLRTFLVWAQVRR